MHDFAESLYSEQQFQNLLHEKKFLPALKLAIDLDQPFRVFTIIRGECISDVTTICVDDVIVLYCFQVS